MNLANITVEQAIAQLNEPVKPEILAPHWDATVKSGCGAPDFLRPDNVRRNRILSGLPPEAEASLLNAADQISRNPVLGLLAKHARHLLFEYDDYNQFAAWPSFEPVLGPLAGTFWLLIAIDTASKIDRLHAALGIPEPIRVATRSRFDVAEQYRLFHNGAWGFPRSSLYWLRYYLGGKLFRIGRLEYKIEPCNGQVTAWRRRKDRAVIAFAPDGTIVQPDGYLHEQPPGAVAPNGWKATLVINEQYAEGCPVCPKGYVLHCIIRLDRKEWSPILQKGDWTLDMHIPPGGRMRIDKCGESMRDAFGFFNKYFPKQPCASITCDSWIFNTQLEEILAPGANLVLFQHELYLHPTPSSGKDGFVFIFDRSDIDPATAPCATSLQRAIADFTAAGNRWRKGGMFFLTDDLPCFGQQYYCRHWPPAGLNIEV